MPLPAPEVVAGPTARLLDTSLLLGPLAYLAADCSYAARGWNDGPTAAMHIVAAAIYGLTAVKLVSLTRGQDPGAAPRGGPARNRRQRRGR